MQQPFGILGHLHLTKVKSPRLIQKWLLCFSATRAYPRNKLHSPTRTESSRKYLHCSSRLQQSYICRRHKERRWRKSDNTCIQVVASSTHQVWTSMTEIGKYQITNLKMHTSKYLLPQVWINKITTAQHIHKSTNLTKRK